MKCQLTAVGLACATLLVGCGGGSGGGSAGAVQQSITFPFPGGPAVGIPPNVATIELAATASSGGPITYVTTTPTTCTVSGSTLSLLKAGECSVNANQAGTAGYAPATARQLFVIPKQPAAIVFRNPGTLALDAQPVTLVATSSASRPVVFTSSTPTVCTVDGSALHKLANGICTVTGTADGGDIYVTSAMVRNIPIGTEKAPALTFLSGYKDTSWTKENGAIGSGSGSSTDGWWCATDWCGRVVPADGSSFTYYYNIQPPAPGGIGAYYGFSLFAPGVNKFNSGTDTRDGIRIDAQGAINFTLAQNVEWISAGNNTLRVDLFLGHYAFKEAKDCNVILRSTIKPTVASATAYSVKLKDFTVVEACGLTGLDAWNELQDYPIVQVGIGETGGANTTVATASAAKLTYSSSVTLTGPVTFQ